MQSTEKRGKREVMSRPSRKDTLIGESESVDDHRSGMTVVKLNGRLNKCGHAWTLEIESWTARLLPTLQPHVSSSWPESRGGGSRHGEWGRPWGRQQQSTPARQIMGTEQWKLLVASRFFPPTLMHRPLFDGRR